jgi:hypothetical protein
MSLMRAISPRRMQGVSVPDAGNVHSTVIPDGDPGRFKIFWLTLEGPAGTVEGSCVATGGASSISAERS